VLRADKDIAWCLYDLHIQDEEGLISAIKEGTANGTRILQSFM
jgi:hypothetical protein